MVRYWEELRQRLRRAPFVPHPASLPPPFRTGTGGADVPVDITRQTPLSLAQLQACEDQHDAGTGGGGAGDEGAGKGAGGSAWLGFTHMHSARGPEASSAEESDVAMVAHAAMIMQRTT